MLDDGASVLVKKKKEIAVAVNSRTSIMTVLETLVCDSRKRNSLFLHFFINDFSRCAVWAAVRLSCQLSLEFIIPVSCKK